MLARCVELRSRDYQRLCRGAAILWPASAGDSPGDLIAAKFAQHLWPGASCANCWAWKVIEIPTDPENRVESGVPGKGR